LSEWQKLQFEQRENVKFCQKLGKSTSETFHMIKQAYDEEALGCNAIFKWHKCPRVLTQDQHDDCMSICSDLIDSAIPMLAEFHSGQRQQF
jgi:hypothetical protein